jgi:hypothetical protein
MKKTIKHSLVLVFQILLVAVMFISPAHAASSVVHDPTGDSLSPAPYLDILHAKVTEQQGKETLFFMMELAGPVPEEPSGLPIWLFHLDTNLATSPGGLYNEYVVRVRWTGVEFVGEVVDRTPLPGSAPIFTPIPFSIDGRTVKVFAQLETLGNPSSFGWNAATRPAPSPPSPAGYVDFAPDGGLATDLATWTQ